MKQRDLELLSSYLDGQLSSADSSRLEARLRTEPELRSVLQDLRGARSILRQLPMRKAPRNFTLTPKMVGKNPPLPRSYPVFRFTAVLASILLFFTMGLNFVGTQMAASQSFAYGMGGGAADTYESAPAAEAPAATEAPALAPSIQMAPLATATGPVGETARSATTASAKEPTVGNAAGTGPAQGPLQAVQPVPPANPVSSLWQWLLAGVALLSLFVMALMRQLSANRWRSRS